MIIPVFIYRNRNHRPPDFDDDELQLSVGLTCTIGGIISGIVTLVLYYRTIHEISWILIVFHVLLIAFGVIVLILRGE